MALPISLQDRYVRERFPQFKTFNRNLSSIEWLGNLQPNEEMAVHEIHIKYKLGNFPTVNVLNWTGKSKHKYKEGNLCLYLKSKQNWDGSKLIAATIIPWTAQWLLFNEFYQITGNFSAAEAEH